jgi:hypothetical protein
MRCVEVREHSRCHDLDLCSEGGRVTACAGDGATERHERGEMNVEGFEMGEMLNCSLPKTLAINIATMVVPFAIVTCHDKKVGGALRTMKSLY